MYIHDGSAGYKCFWRPNGLTDNKGNAKIIDST